MNKFIINEEEKRRILMMHQSATKKQYLNEGTGVFDDLIGKTIIFKPDGIKEILKYDKDSKLIGEYGSDVLNIEGLMDDDTHEYLKYMSEVNLYGKITKIQPYPGSSSLIEIYFTSNMPELNKLGDEIYVTYECGSKLFDFEIDRSRSFSSDGDFLDYSIIRINYTCVKLTEILESRMPCSSEAFDLSLNQEKTPSTLS